MLTYLLTYLLSSASSLITSERHITSNYKLVWVIKWITSVLLATHFSADQLTSEVSQLKADNKELISQLESSQSRLMELSIELGQLRDDVDTQRTQLYHKDQLNGKQHLDL